MGSLVLYEPINGWGGGAYQAVLFEPLVPGQISLFGQNAA